MAARTTSTPVPAIDTASSQGYAAREASAKELRNFKGGDTTVVIGGSALVLIVVVVLVLILI